MYESKTKETYMIEGEPRCTRLGALSRQFGRWIRTGNGTSASGPLLLMLAGVAWALSGSPALAKSVDADAVIHRALAAMGGADVRTITFSGKGSGGLFGQAYEPNVT